MNGLDNMEEKVKAYVLEHYPKLFKDKAILIEEGEKCYFISTSKDTSPLILGKNITE
jgi:hypothetical protein